MAQLNVSILGGSGYAGGELLRLLMAHPDVQVQQAAAGRHAGEYVFQVHPNLRGVTQMKFTSADALEPCDLLFTALPHGEFQKQIGHLSSLAPKIVDLSADFRLNDAAYYEQIYGQAHSAPEWLERFVYGLPESNRAAIQQASYVSGVGCNATAGNLALLPLVRAGLINTDMPVVLDIKAGSSESGASVNPGTHHPVRSNVVRTFSPYGHRHAAEVVQETGINPVHMTITAVELIRGVLAAAHVFVNDGVTEKDLWKAYRSFAKEEPFVRVVKDRRGMYRCPEPKLLTATNFADIGFYLDPDTNRVVSLAAVDNLMKGAAGTAVQCMNLMCGFEETAGLTFTGFHPV